MTRASLMLSHTRVLLESPAPTSRTGTAVMVLQVPR
ncbi:hypothetical protein VD0003_g7428 [Verticillium dahliae]|nr:hypothetical protein VD0003_g7428 [Verticillium dahliae]